MKKKNRKTKRVPASPVLKVRRSSIYGEMPEPQPLKSWRVTWSIDVDAVDAFGAALEALRIQRDPQSIATVFDVFPAGSSSGVEIDLNPEESTDRCGEEE